MCDFHRCDAFRGACLLFYPGDYRADSPVLPRPAALQGGHRGVARQPESFHLLDKAFRKSSPFRRPAILPRFHVAAGTLRSVLEADTRLDRPFIATPCETSCDIEKHLVNLPEIEGWQREGSMKRAHETHCDKAAWASGWRQPVKSNVDRHSFRKPVSASRRLPKESWSRGVQIPVSTWQCRAPTGPHRDSAAENKRVVPAKHWEKSERRPQRVPFRCRRRASAASLQVPGSPRQMHQGVPQLWPASR